MDAKETILRIENLRKYYPITRGFLRRQVGLVKAVDGVTLHIDKGECLSLVGESGCGKTTTCQCVVRIVEPTSGEINFTSDGRQTVNIVEADKKDLRYIRRAIRVVFQDPYSSLSPRMTVRQIIGEPLIIHGVASGRNDLDDKIAEALRTVQLDPAYMNRYPHAFSGGQRQRIAIARALALRPQILLADEPVSALDVSVQAQILNLLRELQGELGLSYLFVAHNLAVVKYVSDRVAIMYVGKVVELAETEELFTAPLHPYTEALLAAAPNPDPRTKKPQVVLSGDIANPANPPSGCYFHPRCRYAQKICANEFPELRNLAKAGTGEHLVACHFAETLSLNGIA
jgi:peptide/nickel transport system ATP-binding protein